MSEAIKIRRSRAEDAPQIIAGLDSICKEGNAFYVTEFRPSPQWEIALYQPDKVPNHLIGIAEDAERVIGAANIFPGPGHSLFQHVGTLGIFMQKPYRYQGIGAQLMAWLIENGQRQGFEKIILTVFANNQPAIHLYQKFGFVQEGHQKQQFKLPNGQYVDALLMALFLS